MFFCYMHHVSLPMRDPPFGLRDSGVTPRDIRQESLLLQVTGNVKNPDARKVNMTKVVVCFGARKHLLGS